MVKHRFHHYIHQKSKDFDPPITDLADLEALSSGDRRSSHLPGLAVRSHGTMGQFLGTDKI